MNQYDIKIPSKVPQLRIFTAVGPVAFSLRAYRIESEMIVSYLQVDSDVVETNLGPCTIANSLGASYRATDIDDLIKVSLDTSNAP